MIKFAISWVLDLFKQPEVVEIPAPIEKKKPTVKRATTRKPAAKKVVAKKATKVVKKAK
jgi:hypothetical protein